MKFEHKKSLGQNFLSNKNLLVALAADAQILPTDNVLEIGPGLGSLTEQLAKNANKVLSVETDLRLKEPLTEKFASTPSVQFLFRDFMKTSFEEIEQILGNDYIVVANLPYYITTPILFRFFEEQNGAKKIAVMVQKEVALRMTASPSCKDYGILSVACQHMGQTKILRQVARQNFNPVPNVDSAFVLVELQNKQNAKEFFNFSRLCFAMRRKTLVNNLKSKYEQQKVVDALIKLGFGAATRAEALAPNQLEQLFELLSK